MRQAKHFTIHEYPDMTNSPRNSNLYNKQRQQMSHGKNPKGNKPSTAGFNESDPWA